ncbi:NAD-dependent aldehyde dehydrogenase [Rhizobium leguminosarum bv. trifolii WSM2297]|uniref:NAD-dependent aldehyde dehydrogenase n=1 Tax=Rhizobium leguminosarum bv. trifolii WSM2297 TaxID=754762 RepID=J0WEG9_RHILT|nr:aldehyde dehydrogenase (NADP(+)) [Rhizobium leguminosarum]EJC83658.1 NAD-dependent aldehyde dehydrogenase [Rhizobium leguminosarum bv. trifolii WSM2297]EJC84751.1 NAD-dependent aldehyde dehydrogenase [Rhizobium leguminosarum bv. trifolii WSM2297]
MTITGSLLIAGAEKRGSKGEFFGIEAATGKPLPVSFGGASAADVEEAARIAWEAFDVYREIDLEPRAAFLEAIAEEIDGVGDELFVRAMAETGLPRGRLDGERARTTGQLRLFAKEVRGGRFQELRFDAGDPLRKPVPKPDLRLRNIPVGPVAVFGASNFPLAFSVAGGDTASALAAGCPVIVKAHSAHPGTSEIVGRAVQKAVANAGLPAGTFALLFDTGFEVGQALVADPRIRAVGFTGSRRGGTALMKIASERKQPIPVYAEMSSINPVILFPAALASRAEEIASSFVGSLALGAGQFCTNPGLILAVDDEGLDAFIARTRDLLPDVAAQTMLTGSIAKAFRDGVGRLEKHPEVKLVANGKHGGEFEGTAALFETTATAFLEHRELQDEVFGAAGLVVRCKDVAELEKVLDGLEGQLTVALHVAAEDEETARRFVPRLEMLAGRLLLNGFGTGVEVSPAMVHGGPYPATADGRSTSVGTLAIYRFLRPVSYQDFGEALLPAALRPK